MPKRTDIKSILIIGAGPIIIGQACEFDYSGTQAVQGAEGRGLPGHPRQLQSGDDHDRSRISPTPPTWSRSPPRSSPRSSRRSGPTPLAPHDGRPDRAQLRAVAAQDGRPRKVRRRDDRRHRRGHRQGRGPRALPRGDEEDRPRDPALDARPQRHRGAPGARGHRPPLHHPPQLHPRRHRRRHRLQPRGIPRHRRGRHRRLARPTKC